MPSGDRVQHRYRCNNPGGVWRCFHLSIGSLCVPPFHNLSGEMDGLESAYQKDYPVSLLAFVLINKFQLHINFYQQFYNLFTQW